MTLSPNTEIKKGLAICKDCGDFSVETVKLPISGREVAKGPYCDRCQEKQDKAAADVAEKTEQARLKWRHEKIHNLLQAAGVKRRYLGCSLESYLGKKPSSIPSIIYGPVGTGKTHLAVGFLREVILTKGQDAGRFIRAVDLFKDIRDSFHDKSAESEKALLYEFGAKVPLLVLDDLGTEKVTEWVEQTLYDLIDRRYGEELTTIVTTNIVPDKLVEHYPAHGDRLVSRILGMGIAFRTYGEDKRIEKAEKKRQQQAKA
jgi:DNA replication protein DnaC